MLSRVADSLYWMSRYLERAEHTARVVSVNLEQSFDRTPDGLARHWGQLLAGLRQPPAMAVAASPLEAAVETTLDLANRDSIAACLAAARENARQVREQISSEMWEELNRLHLHVRETTAIDTAAERLDVFFRSVISGIHLVQGVTDATMPHGESYRFIELGRFVERAGATAAMLDLHYREFAGGSPHPTDISELVEWAGLLKACHAFEPYCQRYTADIDSNRVAEFLVLDADFPRSLRFAAARIDTSLAAIVASTGRRPGEAERLAGKLRASLDYCRCEEILRAPAPFFTEVGRQIDAVHDSVYRQYVDYPIEAELPA